ncbi:MAG: alpha-glucan family phosphorylase [Anaerolineae bacterium]|nr:alpha-glucan family phosphorylase [Anaerolineae bacterium]
MKPIRTLTIRPSLPERLEPLRDIAHNLRWAWNHDTIELFRRLDSDLWETSGHNPVLMLGTVRQSRLEDALSDEGFLAHLDRVAENLEAYLAAKSAWFDREHEHEEGRPLVAYFSAEFAVTECMEIFAGGLGVLAGDHLKSSSDLGVPLVGVGLLYQEGYFRQYLNEAGWQQEFREDNDFYNLPLTLERDTDGSPVTVRVRYPEADVVAQVWRAQVGRIPLYLLDTNLPANARAQDRDITDELYGGDRQLRIRQEIMLGIGGYRALKALGQEPQVYHLNEGHAAFMGLERIRDLMEAQGLSFEEARTAASSSLVFTTHTPVPAGHDYFPMEMMRHYLGDYARGLGLSDEEFLSLGREDPQETSSLFCMTTLALKLADQRNAVSRLHGEVSRDMWQVLWPRLSKEEIPIDHVTNGVHFRSWISLEMNQLYDRYLGPRWREEPADQEAWGRAERIAPTELWRTHERRRERLVAFVRRRLREQLKRRGAPRSEIAAADEALDPRALTIGFARRFATYKRATLLLRDRDRLARLVADPERPVQILFAGKAHPKDEAGKRLIADIVHASREEPFRGRLVFLEDYGMAAARYLVQGSDVWLNTPRRPREASGTSGMKAMANGVLNLSILDGWWDEAYQPEFGWAIGQGEVYDDPEYQDEVEADALYELLEREVVPIFYDRGSDGLPHRWIERMKASLQHLCAYFNTHRMVQEYTDRFYLPAAGRTRRLAAGDMDRARSLAEWKARIREGWSDVEVVDAEAEPAEGLTVRDDVSAKAWLRLGRLAPEDITVQFYFGELDIDGEITAAEATPMEPAGPDGERGYLFRADDVPCRRSGRFGYTIRILPSHPDLATPYLPGLLTWAAPDLGSE